MVELIDRTNRDWNAQKINMIFGETVAKEILATPLNLTPEPDKLIWMANKSSSYTVKSGYNRLKDQEKNLPTTQPSTSYQIPKSLWHEIWKLQICPKSDF